MTDTTARTLRSPLVVVGGGLVMALVVVAVLAPVLAPYEPRAVAGPSLQPPSAAHWLGTNNLGQDLLSKVIWGTRPSLVIGVGAATVTVAVAVAVGVVAGVLGGWADVVAMRVVDVFLAVPAIPLLVLVAALVGVDRTSLALILGLVLWPPIARLVRSQALTLRQRGFVASARGFGGGVGYVLRRHLVPALGPIIVAGFVAMMARAVLLEAGLAFLGMGDPTGVSWGSVLNRALQYEGLYFTPAWTWWLLPAGLAVTLAVLGFTFLGVGLEPALNPRSERTT